jgi:hypothetical protein
MIASFSFGDCVQRQMFGSEWWSFEIVSLMAGRLGETSIAAQAAITSSKLGCSTRQVDFSDPVLTFHTCSIRQWTSFSP